MSYKLGQEQDVSEYYRLLKDSYLNKLQNIIY